jgi:hypothetical protein
MTTGSDDFWAGLLAECSELILAGATVQACLDRYPAHAADLEPLLTTLAEVHALRAVPVRPAAAATRTREQFMAAAVRLAEEKAAAVHLAEEPKAVPIARQERSATWWAALVAIFVPRPGAWGPPRSMPVGLLALLLVVVLAGALVTGGVTASARSLPGDFLYPIKTTTERVQWFFTRDPAARDVLEHRFADRRLQEAKAVVEQGRSVASLPLDGIIEAMNGDTWTVSGLNCTLDPKAQILGVPALGAHVLGVLRAPGDGRLIVMYAEVEAPPPGRAPAAATSRPTATSTQRAPTVTPSATSTAAAKFPGVAVDAALIPPVPRGREPDNWAAADPTASPTLIPTRTATRVPRPTGTPTLTRVPTRVITTDMPPARPQITRRLEGYVERTDGGRWIISGTAVNITGETQISGNPGVGWKVSALVREEADGSFTALQISALAPPEATPEPVEFTDILQSMAGEWWTIGGTPVKIRGDTQIVGDPQIGDLVSMQGERHLTEIWALRIAVIELTEVQFEGIISAVTGSLLVIDGQAVFIDGQTQIIGTPEVGRVAQVAAVLMPDGRLIGKMIVVLDPEPTPTATATRAPTPTPTPTLEPTPTFTPEPTPTPSLEPTPTFTPEPTATPTLEPTAPATLEPPASPSPGS